MKTVEVPCSRRKIPFWRWQIALEQTRRELEALTLYMQAERVDYFSTHPVEARDPSVREFIRQLEIKIAQVSYVLADMERWQLEGKVLGKGVLDRILLGIYQWSKS